jgi:hypothetical protein
MAGENQSGPIHKKSVTTDTVTECTPVTSIYSSQQMKYTFTYYICELLNSLYMQIHKTKIQKEKS